MATFESRISRLEAALSIGDSIEGLSDKTLWRALLQSLRELKEQKALTDDDREFLAACWQLVEFGGEGVDDLERRLIEIGSQHA